MRRHERRVVELYLPTNPRLLELKVSILRPADRVTHDKDAAAIHHFRAQEVR